ncbi:MAG: hypothetical protein ACKOWC_01275 [Limnohabitans sp.]
MPAPQDLTQAHLSHIEDTLERLNQRIARLAHLLGVSLALESTRLKILDGSLSMATDWQALGASGEKRRSHEWAELRGLMVLRMRMMKDTLDELGLEPTYRIAQMVHEHMVVEGFQPGSDGFEMLQRLQAEHDRRARSNP